MSVLKIGDFAPKFQCKEQEGNVISIYDIKAKKVVIFFYTKENTPG